MTIKLKKAAVILITAIIIISVIICTVLSILDSRETASELAELEDVISESKDFIKWVDFTAPYSAMDKALNYDIATINDSVHLNWIDMLAYLAARYGGNFKKYKVKDLDDLAIKLKNGDTIDNLTLNMKYFGYYREAYKAALGGFLGYFDIQVNSVNADGISEKTYQKKYGLKVFSPIAKGYNYNHSDDFGNSRSYGFQRRHLGNDLLGSIGTPIIAVESGIVEELGWNQYGGWRIGIRSLDKKRYYYYAHLRKDKPFHNDLYKGKVVTAGDVIGYMGMTGYSTKENVNNITTPHLHLGLELIFDESQKECNNEIWIDVYDIVKLLQKNRSAVVKNPQTKDYNRVYNLVDPVIGGP